jgi:hypothetical protein
MMNERNSADEHDSSMTMARESLRQSASGAHPSSDGQGIVREQSTCLDLPPGPHFGSPQQPCADLRAFRRASPPNSDASPGHLKRHCPFDGGLEYV